MDAYHCPANGSDQHTQESQRSKYPSQAQLIIDSQSQSSWPTTSGGPQWGVRVGMEAHRGRFSSHRPGPRARPLAWAAPLSTSQAPTCPHPKVSLSSAKALALPGKWGGGHLQGGQLLCMTPSVGPSGLGPTITWFPLLLKNRDGLVGRAKQLSKLNKNP